VRVGDSRFFFLDDLIYSFGVQQSVVKGNVFPEPVISLGGPGSWDEKRIQFSSVLYDKHKRIFRMWYLGLGDEPECESGEGPGSVVHRGVSYIGHTKQGYAESLDGVNWVKPSLGLFEYNGSSDNNIVSVHPALPGSPMVIEDPEEGDNPHRYKMILSNGGGGGISFSDDGIHWHSYKDGINLYQCGSERGREESFDLFTQEPYSFIKDIFTSDDRKRYRIYTQASSGPPNWVRRTGLAYSSDARHWEVHPEPVMGLPDGGSGISGQVHGLAVMLYKGYYVAFIHLCLPHPKTGWLAPRAHLAISTDGENFKIFEDEASALIPAGPDSSWWEGGVTSDSVLAVGDKIFCYFTGLNAKAAWDGNPESEERPALNTGLALWDVDRLLSVSLKPGYSEGYFMLPAVYIKQDCVPEVCVNADLNDPTTDLKFAMLYESTRLIVDGFGFDDFRLNSELSGGWSSRILRSNDRVVPCVRISGNATRMYSLELHSREV
jgi:hypothetical protein